MPAGPALTQAHTPQAPQPAIRSVLVALMLAIFLGALDQTIVAVSMPAISAQFGDVSLLAWVISDYMVAMTVEVPIYGKGSEERLVGKECVRTSSSWGVPCN